MPKRPIKVNKQTPFLDVKKLSIEIEGKSLLSNISLKLSDNEILALVENQEVENHYLHSPY